MPRRKGDKDKKKRKLRIDNVDDVERLDRYQNVIPYSLAGGGAGTLAAYLAIRPRIIKSEKLLEQSRKELEAVSSDRKAKALIAIAESRPIRAIRGKNAIDLNKEISNKFEIINRSAKDLKLARRATIASGLLGGAVAGSAIGLTVLARRRHQNAQKYLTIKQQDNLYGENERR